ncbi:MAG: hypothetical protein QXN05_01465 [Acidilobaceae archaeon]
MEASELKAIAVRVSSLSDLVRFASSTVPAMVVMPIYRFKENKKVYYFLQTVYKDFFKYYGIPIIYYYSTTDDGLDSDKAKFILFKADEEGEKIEISNKTKAGCISIPLVNLDKRPPFLPEDLD